jgi:PKD domain
MRSRSLAATLLVAASLAVLLSGAAQAKHLAAVRDTGDHAAQASAADFTSLPYHGGPVLHWNRTHLIFWAPAGSGLSFNPGYRALIKRFLSNVAAASHSGSNVYGLTGQYRDRHGPAAYASIYGGAVTATDPLPATQLCHEPAPPTGPPGWSACVIDAQMQQEIERVVRRKRLPTTANDLYFLVTPDGLGDCEYAYTRTCALGGDVYGYCGYHSQTDDGLVLYAVIPYNAVAGHCQSDNPRPNDSPADPTISTISHEQSEMVTDPVGSTGWIDWRTGEETGDVCLLSFGPAIGGSGKSAWNEELNGGHYYLQEEWSNFNGNCEPRAMPDSSSFQAGGRPGHGLSTWFSALAHDPEGRIVAYRWFFGDGRTGHGKWTVHRYPHRGRYRVVVRTTDSWGNWAFNSSALTISRAGVTVSPSS